jgi:FdhD protein
MSGKKNLKPIDVPNVKITVAKLFNLMKSLYSSCDQYHLSGGIHGSGLSLDGENLTYVAEDIGRHNTLDKVAGECVIRGNATRGAILLTTGRISYDMMAKASRMEIPIVVSRTSPTLLAQELAQQLGITLVGYVRGDKLRVYSCHSRVIA